MIYFYNIIQQQMLSESNRKNKENYQKYDISSKEGSSLLQSTITALKDEISILQQDKNMIEKQWVSQVYSLNLELNQYKKKLSAVTDKYLLETLTKEKQQYKQPTIDNERLLREKQILLEQQQQTRKKVEQELKKYMEQNNRLKKQVTMIKYEKQKSMEISLIEKIQLQEKTRLLQQEVKSKRNIINNLKKEIQKAYSNRQQLDKRQRTISQKSKELDCYSKQINQYNRLSEAKLNQKVQYLKKQNDFLKEYIKKLEKMAKKQCQCESKQQKVKENMFQIKRQLALAKVRLGQSYLKRNTNSKKHIQRNSSCSSNESLQSKRK